jgi:hypothetical protein
MNGMAPADAKMKRGFLFLLLSFTIIPIVAIGLYVILVRSVGAATIIVLGGPIFIVNLANPAIEEFARYVAARISKVSPGWVALGAGALFGLAEQYVLSFSREREYPADVFLNLSILAAPVAAHGVDSVLCAASVQARSPFVAFAWFATAVLLHTLNNNPDLYSRWFTSETFWFTHVALWAILLFAASAAIWLNRTRASSEKAPE